MSAPDDENDLETESEEDEAEVSVNYEIATYPSDFTLSGISQMWIDGDIEIPDYQREFVWSIKQSSLLIDSFLRGLPVPPVFFYVDEDSKNIVIDGQQRILSVVFYLEGYFGKESTHGKRQVFRLTGIGENNHFNRRTFDELAESDQRKLKQSVLRAINIKQLRPIGESTSAYHIFERLNTGGVPLKPQEIRNCVFRGEFCQLLKEANTDPNWRKILGRKNIDKHLRDVEFILRVFSLVGSAGGYEKPMKEFLNVEMGKHRSGKTSKVREFFKAFPIVTDLVVRNLGERPFHIRGPLNISVLDSVMSVCIENHRKLTGSRNLKKRFEHLRQDQDFIDAATVNTTDTKTVNNRLTIVCRALLDQ
ncbi:MAG: DUF262 domain-containing protein [Candidatus Hydrogenedentes bacterium]|nr:DUF262 domain-containing protein [Candidatus Hydrogenedentota bacterium]